MAYIVASGNPIYSPIPSSTPPAEQKGNPEQFLEIECLSSCEALAV